MTHLNAEITEILLKHVRGFCKPVTMLSAVLRGNRKHSFKLHLQIETAFKPKHFLHFGT